ncbi:MAG: hypothetical protein JWP97_6221 [Labilithrix sp.]|nr:hypothetical protein [Labilithrix sp.]
MKLRPLYVVGERVRHGSMRKRAATRDFSSKGAAFTPDTVPPVIVPAPTPDTEGQG